MQRRHFIKTSASTAALAAAPAALSAQTSKPAPLIDTNAYLGRWPFRNLPLGQPDRLEEKLRALGATEAWTGSFHALLRRDLDTVNSELHRFCRERKFFRPIGAVNPAVPGWRETLRRCHESAGMTAIRLHPNYHGYTLDDPNFAALLADARDRNLLVQIALRMEDTRTQHPEVAVPDVDPAPLLPLLAKLPGARVQLLNAMRTVRNDLLLQRLGRLGVHVEIAMLESMEGVRRFLDRSTGMKLVFGSYAPFFYPESAVLKLQESVLTDAELAALRSGYAAKLISA